VQSRLNIPEDESGKVFYLRVGTEIEALVNVLDWFEKNIPSLIPTKASWECQLAMTEGFTNTVKHAHRNLPKETPIELRIILTSNYLEMQIWDLGQPFDLIAKLEEIEQREYKPLELESDRGLSFIKQLTDDLQYIRCQGQNCLIMVKRLDFSNGSFN
jgi:serine/threonine-protein kinase RsbW